MNIQERKKTKLLTLDSLINEFDSITADVHKLCAEYFSEKLVARKYGIIYEAEDKTYARYTDLQIRISAYIRKLEQLSTQENLEKLYNENKLASSVSDTDLSRKDAVSGLNELGRMYKHCKDREEKEYLQNVKDAYKNAINTLIRMVTRLLEQNDKEALLRGKDFSYLE